MAFVQSTASIALFETLRLESSVSLMYPFPCACVLSLGTGNANNKENVYAEKTMLYFVQF